MSHPYIAVERRAEVRVGWWHHAACNDLPWTFEAADAAEYVGRRGNGYEAAVAAAKAICRTCPVRRPCLAEAMSEEQLSSAARYSVRGGLTPVEREALARELMGE